MHLGALLLIFVLVIICGGPAAVLRAVAGLSLLAGDRRDRALPALGGQPNTGSLNDGRPACSDPHPINLGEIAMKLMIRKHIYVGPWVRLNIFNTGFSVSLGRRGITETIDTPVSGVFLTSSQRWSELRPQKR
jgi:hypothetical protein